MEINFLCATAQCDPSAGKLDALHAEDALIKVNRALNIGDGYHQMVDSIDLHCLLH